jgi:hypothetical protein
MKQLEAGRPSRQNLVEQLSREAAENRDKLQEALGAYKDYDEERRRERL